MAKINQSMAQADPKAFRLFLIQINEFMGKTMRKLKRLEKKAPSEPAVVETPEAPASETP
ncbi:hypothetical protein Desde_1776 [Desulfitobacterium dehalogenans ATCC 51507]|uniref:Uncharacterized protein n=1 Tax=Desulfitobacterium dehalogenans (strain ATCC 51507 / DSM 9161 / JW/IU-DC1) TaxID=756499 RepID=I4A887_DESDJ|nr:hypothetical protein [Desulfitobacterium dehalogenans]AFM00172.1 hypothetical protein Desde_1776 [Desulfitobacterium dehalogenans ATCC 51507]